MDTRIALPSGEKLPFPGMPCTIAKEIGRGSNAIVYEASYPDAKERARRHRVLVKELFPYHPKGAIRRAENGDIFVSEEGRECWETHYRSFSYGNRIHLELLEEQPAHIGGNLNTFPCHETFYTVLEYSGGRSLQEELAAKSMGIRELAKLFGKLIESLSVIHRAGYLHLDIAPDNILLIGEGEQERVLLIDYNSMHPIAHILDEEGAVFSMKQGYTAPEIRSGRFRAICPASDMYSLAAVFYRCLAGKPLTAFEMIRPAPPKVSNCPMLLDQPETVKHMAWQILARGLQALPERRYASPKAMREDVQELLDRVDGVGITHWALWEAGQRQCRALLEGNPALAYLREKKELFPADLVTGKGQALPVQDYIQDMASPGGEHTLLEAPGGMGKTTAMLCAMQFYTRRFDPGESAAAYISLYGYAGEEGKGTWLRDKLLEQLRFRPETQTYQNARHALDQLLDKPLQGKNEGKPVLLLFLDGLNEVSGDAEGLLGEIRELSQKAGIRFLVATRSGEPALHFAHVRLCELQDQSVAGRLAEAGLLLPESKEVRELLKIPLMLSLYLRTAQASGQQLSIANRDALFASYLESISQKAVRDMAEDSDAKWQIEAAMELVFPALAGELERKGRALGDAELLPAVQRCYRIFSESPVLLRSTFPQWIGQSKVIRGGAGNAEEWYGQIVHRLLWKRLGLLVRTEEGEYRLAHQILQDYLLSQHRDTFRRIRRIELFRRGKYLIVAALFACTAFFAYFYFIKPKPYDEGAAENAIAYAVRSYGNAGYQYEHLRSLLDAAIISPETYQNERDAYGNYERRSSLGGSDGIIALQCLENLQERGGDVIPWSGKPLEMDAYQQLARLYQERVPEYASYVEVLDYVMGEEGREEKFAKDYLEDLSGLAEIDADIAAYLYLMVCAPHQAVDLSDNPVAQKSLDDMSGSQSLQNEHVKAILGGFQKTPEMEELRRDLNIRIGDRKQAKTDLDTSGIVGYYQDYVKLG